LQTIRALSKVTEVGGYTESGHARRVSVLASRIGSELGMTERELTDLEYAALMHDIGQLAWPEPFPGGATSLIAPVHQRRIAELGAEVVRQSGALDSVALIVERQADSYRPAPGLPDESLPLASRIIKVANSYDDSVGASLDMERMQYALDRLAGASDREYDPAVIDALSRIVDRRFEQSYT
jgi:response regulator RpfG family c-di-GMP phosphodiesterase